MVLAAKKLAAENQILVDMYHKDIACGSGFCKTVNRPVVLRMHWQPTGSVPIPSLPENDRTG